MPVSIVKRKKGTYEEKTRRVSRFGAGENYMACRDAQTVLFAHSCLINTSSLAGINRTQFVQACRMTETQISRKVSTDLQEL